MVDLFLLAKEIPLTFTRNDSTGIVTCMVMYHKYHSRYVTLQYAMKLASAINPMMICEFH